MAQHERDVERLETALSERVQELRGLRSELDRRATLIRDLTVRWESLPAAQGSAATLTVDAESMRLRAERDAAIARALDAEAALLESRFRIDELAGHLSTRTAAPDPMAAEREAATLAEHQGTLRGLRARLAEAEDARDRAEARLMLTEHDLDDARSECDALRRQRLELGERLELEALRARTAEADSVRLRGELLGVGARAAESEAAVRVLAPIREQAVEQNRLLDARLMVAFAERDAARSALEVARAERDAALTRLAQQDADPEEVAGLRRDLLTTRNELAEREADLATLSAAQGDLTDARDRALQLHEALLESRQTLRELSAWLGGEGQSPSVASTTSFELETPLGVSNRPPREDETLPGVPLHVQAMQAVETLAVEALEEQLAQKDEQLRALEARLDELLRSHRTL